ncbi:MAG: hypothetical protein HC817_00995 [Saprospiraceae bacterium]|nr:hypothetical protein [Saprospiraceae bacterium]
MQQLADNYIGYQPIIVLLDCFRQKIGVFREVSKTKKAVFLTMMTTYGVEKNNMSLSLVQNEVVLDDLFM